MGDSLPPGAFPPDANEETTNQSFPQNWSREEIHLWTTCFDWSEGASSPHIPELPPANFPHHSYYGNGSLPIVNYQTISLTPPSGLGADSRDSGSADPLSSQSCLLAVENHGDGCEVDGEVDRDDNQEDEDDHETTEDGDDHDNIMQYEEGNGSNPDRSIANLQIGGGIKRPKFIPHLFSLAQNPNVDCVGWTQDGQHLVFTNEQKFMQLMKKASFKAKQFGSFVRQLNGYGFAKTERSGQSSKEQIDTAYHHKESMFLRDRPDLLNQIRRGSQKTPKSAGGRTKATPLPASDPQTPRAIPNAVTGPQEEREDVVLNMRRQIDGLQAQVQRSQEKCKMLEAKTGTQDERIARLEQQLSALIQRNHNAEGQLRDASSSVPGGSQRQLQRMHDSNFATNATNPPLYHPSRAGLSIMSGRAASIINHQMSATFLPQGDWLQGQIPNPIIPIHQLSHSISYTPTTTTASPPAATVIPIPQPSPAVASVTSDGQALKRRRVDSNLGSWSMSPVPEKQLNEYRTPRSEGSSLWSPQ
ncbi:stress-responsive transcription factor hsf1 [Tulasnella sp. JGI-2019a]|nr:stress-responsive transcription factor hsf1 [Tulasnella sp. JGI-2019a]KAG9004269.1 stress-responsive transcription factor hsf1 [Tulasnella sp. JGI-2019a]